MKVILINGSAKKEGCTAAALNEVARALHEEGIETETIFIGNKALQDCMGCGKCRETGKCIFDDLVNEFAKKPSRQTDLCLAHLFIMRIRAQGFWHSWTGRFIQVENI